MLYQFTVRPVLWKHKKNSKGLCPIMIAITIQRRVTYIKTPYKILETQWDADDKLVRSHDNGKIINAWIKHRVNELMHDISTKSMQGISVTPKVLKAGQSMQFEKFAKEVRNEPVFINRIVNFGGPNLLLTDIDVKFLRTLETNEHNRGMAINTLNVTFKYLRRIMNQAKAEKLIAENPFDSYRVPRYEQSERIYLIEKEKKELLKLLSKGIDPSLHPTLVYFLLGCFTGLRNSDWRQFDYNKQVHDGFIRLRAIKNNKQIVLPVGNTLEKILEHTKDSKYTWSNQDTNRKLKAIASMAGIKKTLTSHVGRHTFGYLCASKGIPESTTAALLGVTPNVVKVYYHLSGSNITEQAAILKNV